MTPQQKSSFREKCFKCPHSFGYSLGMQDLMIHSILRHLQKLQYTSQPKSLTNPTAAKPFDVTVQRNTTQGLLGKAAVLMKNNDSP